MQKYILFCLPLLAITVPAWGQASKSSNVDCPLLFNENSDPVSNHCAIEVIGNLPASHAEKTEAISTVNLIEGRLENALLQVSGLQQFRRSDARSANPTSQGVTLRGLGGNASSRAVLILDDVPQADPFGGWISWPGYDALNLANVRVRKGAGQVASGAGALAGVIELDSLQNQHRFDAAVHYGSRNSVDAKASLLRKLGDGSLSVSGSYARGDGFIPVIATQRGAVDRAAPYEQAGIALRAVAPVSDTTEFQASIRAFTDKRDRGFDFSDSQNSGVDGSVRLVRRADGWQYSALAYVQLRDFANRFGGIGANRNSVSLVLDQFSVPSTGLGARFEVRPPVGDAAELRIGGDWRRTIGRTRENFFFAATVPGRNRIAGGRNDSFGGFIEGSVTPNDNLTLTAAGRLDRWIIAEGFRTEINLPSGSVRSDDKYANRSGWEGTGRLGFAWTPGLSDWKVRGAAYRGWRLPTLNELYRPFRVGADATAANELLSPERLSGAEVGLDYDGGHLHFAATGFLNRLDHAIANVSLGVGPGNFSGVGFVGAGGTYRQRRNLEAIDSQGVELEARYTLDNFILRAGYAYVDARIDGSGVSAALDGLRLAQVPRHFANASLAYEAHHFTLYGRARYVSGQFEDDANSRRLKSAFTIDAGGSVRLRDRFRFELRSENLFDTKVQAAIGSDGVVERATPRTIWVGVAVEI